MPYEPERPYGWIKTPSAMKERRERTEKPCIKCGRVLPCTEAYFRRRKPEGGALLNVCRACASKEASANKKKRKEEGKLKPIDLEYHRRWARRQREMANVLAGYSYAPRRWWNTARVSAELGLREERVRELIRQGAFVAQRHGRVQWRCEPESVLAYRDARNTGYRHPRTATKMQRKHPQWRGRHAEEAAD